MHGGGKVEESASQSGHPFLIDQKRVLIDQKQIAQRLLAADAGSDRVVTRAIDRDHSINNIG